MIRRAWAWWCDQALHWQLWATLGLNAAWRLHLPIVRDILPSPDYAIQVVLHGRFASLFGN